MQKIKKIVIKQMGVQKTLVVRGSEGKSYLTRAVKDLLCAVKLCERGLDVR